MQRRYIHFVSVLDVCSLRKCRNLDFTEKCIFPANYCSKRSTLVTIKKKLSGISCLMMASAGGPGNFAILHKRGDMFTCAATDSLAHCVSMDLRMGKGIAVLFKQKFNGLNELKQQGKKVGDVAVLKHGERFVYYLITKPKYHNKPTYDSLEQSLYAMKKHCVENNVTRICMPRIGCGLDRLEWTRVEGQLIKLFQDTDVVITVYSL